MSSEQPPDGTVVRDVPCAWPECPATYKQHRWGMTKAHGAGWMIQKDGTSWCPEHLPEWVEAWRARNSRQP